jgi:hypothetical protein
MLTALLHIEAREGYRDIREVGKGIIEGVGKVERILQVEREQHP